jgi:hypothetical protein
MVFAESGEAALTEIRHTFDVGNGHADARMDGAAPSRRSRP